MPPRAIRSAVSRRPSRSASAEPVRSWWRSRNSSDHRRRELRRAAEPAVPARRSSPRRSCDGGRRGASASTRRGRQRRGGVVGEPRGDLPGRAAHPLAVLAPGLRHGFEQRCAEARGGRVVGAAVERLARRGEEAGHRPAALAGHRLGGRHVDRVDVRPFLAVDLDRDEVRVELRGGRGVLERLVRHDVAPVAGRVADREQHRHVAAGRLLERRVRPLPPVDGVVGVLQQVGRVAPASRFGMRPSLSGPGASAARPRLVAGRPSDGGPRTSRVGAGVEAGGHPLEVLVHRPDRKTIATPSRMTTTQPERRRLAELRALPGRRRRVLREQGAGRPRGPASTSTVVHGAQATRRARLSAAFRPRGHRCRRTGRPRAASVSTRLRTSS